MFERTITMVLRSHPAHTGLSAARSIYKIHSCLLPPWCLQLLWMLSKELTEVCYPAREAPLKVWADLCCALQIVLFNLPWGADAEALARDFADCGDIKKAEIQHDQDGRSRVSLGLCFLLRDVHLAMSSLGSRACRTRLLLSTPGQAQLVRPCPGSCRWAASGQPAAC